MKKVILGIMLLGLVAVAAFTVHSSRAATNTSLRFYGNGVNDIDRVKISVDTPNRPVDVGNNFTIEWWMKANLTENDAGGTCSTGNDNWITGNIMFDRDIWGNGDYGDFGISLKSGKVEFGVNNGSTGTTVCATPVVTDGNWHHIAATRNGSTGQLSIYVDGALSGQRTGPVGNLAYRDGRSTSFTDDPFLVIGAEKHDAGGSYPSYSGWIDEVRVSDIVRYTTNFSPPNVQFVADPNTVALYHFNEGAGDIIGDSSEAAGGPSSGIRRYGGNPAGPAWSDDTPFGNAVTPTPTGAFPPTPTPTLAPTTVPPTPTSAPTGTPAPTTTPLPTPSAAPGAYSLRFDGVNDVVRTVNLPLLTNFTLEAWVKRTVDTNYYQMILSDATSSYSQTMFSLYVDSANSDCPGGPDDEFAYYQSAGNSIQCSGVSVGLNVWHHVAVSRDTTGARRFVVDGILTSTQVGTPAPTDSGGVFAVGRAGSFNGEYFAGLIDEVKVTSNGNLIAWYRMNEGTGQRAYDSSGNNRTGTLGSSTNPDSADPTWVTDTP